MENEYLQKQPTWIPIEKARLYDGKIARIGANLFVKMTMVKGPEGLVGIQIHPCAPTKDYDFEASEELLKPSWG